MSAERYPANGSPTEEKPSITTLYSDNRYLLFLTIIILLVAGWGSVNNLPIQEDPRITTRNGFIVTAYPGASAERVEALVNKKIEQVLQEIDEIKRIQSTARAQMSVISIELQASITRETNEEIFSRIRSELQLVSGELPPEASVPVLDIKRTAAAYNVILGLRWEGATTASENLLNRVAEDLQDRMLNMPNMELVKIFGTVAEEITVTPDMAELAVLGITTAQLAQIIQQADSKIAAGNLHTQRQRISLEISGSLNTVTRIERIPVISTASGTTLRVGDIAQVERAVRQPSQQKAMYNHEPVVFLALRSNDQVRAQQWVQSVFATLDEFRSEYDDHLNIETVFEQNSYTSERLNGLVGNLVAGAVIVVLVILFTMGWRAGLVVGSALPLSAAGAIFSLSFFDQGIHQMSIFGMIIAIGLLIDSAIVMTDEVRKQIQRGASRHQAMDRAVRHLFAPLFASTLTTILGFMPIFLLPGNAGDFVSPIAISVVMALCFSFFLAMTVIPALASGIKPSTNRKRRWWDDGLEAPAVLKEYQGFVRYALSKPKRFLMIPLIPCVLGFLAVPTMEVEFFPAGDRDMFEIRVWMPGATNVDETFRAVKRIDTVVREFDGVKDTYWLAGSSIPPVYYNQIPTQDNNSRYAQGVVVADSIEGASNIISPLQAALNDRIPEASIVVRRFAQGPPSESPVEFRIVGPDVNVLRELGEQTKKILHQYPGITATRASIEGGEPKLWFNANETEANMLGLTLSDLARQIYGNTEGYTGGSVLEDVEQLPIRVRAPLQDRNSQAALSTVPILLPPPSAPNAGNSSALANERWVTASVLGEWQLLPEIATITRYNSERTNHIFAYTAPGVKAVSMAQTVLSAIQKDIVLPKGYSIAIAGESEQQADAVGNLLIYAPLLMIMMVATLILAFRSVALAAIVGLVALLSVGLGMLALKISGYALGFNPMLGSLGLIGVAINDTIVVLAAIRANPLARQGDIDAITSETFGCGRHVMSTTLTTVGGLVPLLLFSGGSFWPPLAVVIAGGVAFAIMLAMLFTPLAYKVLADIRARNYRRAQHNLPDTRSAIP